MPTQDKNPAFSAARGPGKTRMVAGFPFPGDPDYPEDKLDKVLRNRGLRDKNGFPILDPPGARNRLRKTSLPVDTERTSDADE